MQRNHHLLHLIVRKQIIGHLFMKKTLKGILSLAAGILAVVSVSCQKDDTLYYNNLTMGNIVDGRFVSDQGNIFNIVDQTCEGKIEEMERAIVLCDVLNETNGAEKEYDVRLTDLRSVLEKSPVHVSEAVSEDIAAADPVNIEELWYSGGYLNMLISFYAVSESQTKHLINLVYDKDEEGTYVFHLRHNAFGEVASMENLNKMRLVGAYVSFPLRDAVAENEAKFAIKWDWYKRSVVTGYGWDVNTKEEYDFEYEWKRTGFEQVPKVQALKSTSEIY